MAKDETPKKPAGQSYKDSVPGRSGKLNEQANDSGSKVQKVTDWVKPEKPPKKP